jgi:chemotaxis signal transduction protein
MWFATKRNVMSVNVTELLAYRTGEKEYGVDIQKVHEPEQIKPPSAMGTAVDTDFLLGLGRIEKRMLILLNIDRLMSSCEIGLNERLAA